MILRDVTYSDQHRLLPGAEVAVLRPAVAEVMPAPAIEVNALEVKVKPEPPLTLERVNAWLDGQDARIRTELASQLDTEIERLRARAVEEGQSVGAKIAVQEVQAQFDKTFLALQALTKEADALFARQRHELAQICVAVVDAALAKLLGTALREPGASMAAVMQAIAHLTGSREVTIRVNASELDVITSKRTAIAESLGDDTFKLVADPRVSSGGCLVESSFGEIDARWESQLVALTKTLQDHDATPSERS